MTKIYRPLLLSLFFVAIMIGASASAFATATIVILNNDAAGVGFNDTTAATPVGGNNGTTLGQQRLNAFQAAADKWGATLDSPITITIRAQWAAQTCTATSAVLGSAGAIGIFRDFTGAPFAGTWYNESLTSKLFGSDPNATQPEINATFNVNLGQPGCLTGTFFYLGLDNNHGANIDLVTVLEHEFGHGLGFQTFTNSQTGAFNSGFVSIYDRFLMDLTTGKSWIQMTNAERAASAIKAHKLAWNGPQVQADVPTVLSFGIPVVRINSPAGIAGDYDAGTASYGPQPTAGGVTGNLKLADDGTAPITDGCEPFAANFFSGQIAVIDRGTCSFKTKTLNAQNAGATAVIIVNNVAGTPAPGLGEDATITTPITIPTVSLTLPDGNTVKAQLGGTVNGTILLNTSIRAGADPFGKALLFTPDPFTAGSSVSHWDTIAFPNQLMEPNINADLTHEVTPPTDLTYSQLRDIGWVASAIPTGISKTGGDNQNTALSQPFSTPLQVTVSPAIAGITVTWTANAGGTGSNGSFPTTGSTTVSVTNASGVATAPTLTANGTSGFFSVNATAPGAGTTTFNVSIDPAPVSGPACLTDTTQADFAAGTTNNTDVNASPGNVVLLNTANPDQTQTVASTSGTGFNTTQWLGQTFVPGVTGNLAKIDMALFCASCSGTDQPITVEVRTTDSTSGNALPTSTVLATTTITGFNSGASSTFSANFAVPAALTSGTTYAYTLRLVTNRTGTYAAVFGNAPTDYANGNRVVSTNSGGTWTVPTSTGIARDLVFTTFMQTGNAPSGDYTSSAKDSNPPVAGTTQWSTLSWNATVPAGTTLQFQAAASNSFGGPFNFVGPNGTPGTFFTNGASLSQFNGFRYLKYKAFFTTSNGAATATLSDVTVCYYNPVMVRHPADYDGDGKTDLLVFRPSEGKWYVRNSATNTAYAQPWGLSTDKIVYGDYDGDGRGDFAVFRESEGNWYILLNSGPTSIVVGWGQSGDKPVPADYDGDGKTDVAVFRPSEGNWYVKKSTGGSSVTGWGNSTDTLVPADYDADGKADVAIFRPSEGNWYIKKSTGGSSVIGWGQSGDKAVPGDYDGDQIADVAVFRPAEGNWYIKKSTGGSSVTNWGNASDKPVAADYDGDGRFDIAIWRESEGNFYIRNSATNTVSIFNLGTTGDIPVIGALIP